MSIIQYLTNMKFLKKRQDIIIERIKSRIRKGNIALSDILSIGKDDMEYDFIYDYLDDNDIQISGKNGTVSGELENYSHIVQYGKSYKSDVISEQEQLKYFQEMEKYPQKSKGYNDARNKIVEGNKRLSDWIVGTWHIKSHDTSISQDDIKQMGYFGLIKAADRFDYQMGFKFSTYASKVIYHTIQRQLYTQDRYIEDNYIVNNKLKQIEIAKEKMENYLGREPTHKELSEMLNTSIEDLDKLLYIESSRDKRSIEQIEDDDKDFEKTMVILQMIQDTLKMIVEQ